MSTQEYICLMNTIHRKFLKYIDAEALNENKFQKFYSLIQENGFIDDKIKFKSILQMIKMIADNHRSNDLYLRVQKTLLFFKDKILETFKNLEIYSIFETNRKITLFLIKSNVITIDEPITHRIIKRNDSQFFYPEIKPFINYNTALYSTLELIPASDSLSTNRVIYSNSIFFSTEDMRNLKQAVNQDEIENFEEKRQIGENDSDICSLIRKDSITDFIIYINQNNLSLSSHITPSSFETNSFLLKNNETTLIEYAAFFGAIQIFKYLYMNEVKLTPSLWNYVIHGRNLEIFQLLDDNKITSNNIKILYESIKCHHNEITNYILDNFVDDSIHISSIKCLKYFNFEFVHNNYQPCYTNQFCELCKYNQTTLLELLSKALPFDVNERSIGGFGYEEITLLSYAIINDNTEMAKFLLSYEDIDVDILSYFPNEKRKQCSKCSKSSIILAIERENVEIVKDLIKKQNIKFDVNFAFKLALELNNTEIAKLILLCHNIKINNQSFDYTESTKSGGNKTLLSLAIEYENIEVVKYLLTFNDIDINQYSMYYKYGYYHEKITPLALAIEKSNIEIIKLLVSSPMLNINRSSEYYITGIYREGFVCPRDKKFGKINPLFMAVDKENIEIIKLLLSNDKIDIFFTTMYREFNEKEYKCKKLMDFASEKQNKEIVEILKEFKSKKQINVPTFNLPFHYNEKKKK